MQLEGRYGTASERNGSKLITSADASQRLPPEGTEAEISLPWLRLRPRLASFILPNLATSDDTRHCHQEKCQKHQSFHVDSLLDLEFFHAVADLHILLHPVGNQVSGRHFLIYLNDLRLPDETISSVHNQNNAFFQTMDFPNVYDNEVMLLIDDQDTPVEPSSRGDLYLAHVHGTGYLAGAFGDLTFEFSLFLSDLLELFPKLFVRSSKLR